MCRIPRIHEQTNANPFGTNRDSIQTLLTPPRGTPIQVGSDLTETEHEELRRSLLKDCAREAK